MENGRLINYFLVIDQTVTSKMDRIEREGTLDKLSELHTLHTIASRHPKEKDEESEVFDQEALENAAENLMQHLSVDQLDMLHHRFMTGELPDDMPEMSEDDESDMSDEDESDNAGSSDQQATIQGQDSFEASGSMMSSNISARELGSEETSRKPSMMPKSSTGSVNPMAKRQPRHSMNIEEWTEAVCGVVGSMKATSDAEAMFRLMDQKQQGYVTWTEVLDMFVNKMEPTTEDKLTTAKAPLEHDNKFKSILHTRRETVAKMIGVSSGPTYVYIIISKFGNVGIYDEKFRLQRQYEIDIDTDPDSDLDVAASDPGWITDGLWMDNSKHAVYTTSLRTMHFYDASASVHYEEYRAFGFRSIPTCIDYAFDEEAPDEEALLLFGDAEGGLTVVHFLQPLNSLFEKDEVDSVQCLFWPDMKKHEEYARIDYYPKLHSDGILGLKYQNKNKTVITISRDPQKSLVIRQIKGKFDSYIFKLGWGVRCFDHCSTPSLSLVVTGSNDRIVRLWNPVVTTKPVSLLAGHKAGLNDVKIRVDKRLIFSYDKKAVLKTWDIDLGYCLQTLPLHFPSFEILGKEIEFGRPALYTETSSEDLILATCCEHFTCIDLTKDEEESEEDEDSLEETTKKFSKVSKAAKVALALGGTMSNPTSNEDESSSEKTDKKEADPVMEKILDSVQEELDTSMFSTKTSQKTPISQTGWGATKTVIRSRQMGRMFMGKRKKKENAADFRLFREKFTDDNELSLNSLRVQKYLNNTRMKELASDNMPFMALEIHGLEEVTLKQDLPHTANMLQRGIQVRTIDDLVNMRLDSLGSSALGKLTSGTSSSVPGLGGGMHTSMEVSSMTSGSFDKSSADGRIVKKGVKPMEKRGQPKLTDAAKGLPMISEKSGTPSEVSAT